jgi:hypothetical protein
MKREKMMVLNLPKMALVVAVAVVFLVTAADVFDTVVDSPKVRGFLIRVEKVLGGGKGTEGTR